MHNPDRIPVNEIFETLQGEAHYTGAPSVFIRLQGCDVGCAWCDTKHTWELNDTQAVPLADIVAKTSDGPSYALATVDDLVQIVAKLKSWHVVITGGEPCMYDLRQLTGRLHGIGRSVQVETSATSPVQVDRRTWVTVSPKVNMGGGLAVLLEAVERADEIKMPVGRTADIENLEAILGKVRGERLCPDRGRPMIWLQPLSASPKATALCVQAAAAKGWSVSVQVHKFIGMR